MSARWPAGTASDAGLDSRVDAAWIPRAGPGRATGRDPGGAGSGSPDWIAVDLGWAPHGAGPSQRALYGSRAPLVDALMLGRRGGIDPDLQDRFAQSGLVHLLSISGFHVGLIGGWIFMVARLLGVRRDPALIVAAAASTAYVGFIGWPAPATRAAALALVLARCRVRQRHVRPDELLAATCLIVLLLDPWAAIDLGGWLSAAALWGATRFSRWTDAALGRGFGWRTLGSSVGATLATAPITAWALGHGRAGRHRAQLRGHPDRGRGRSGCAAEPPAPPARRAAGAAVRRRRRPAAPRAGAGGRRSAPPCPGVTS